MTRRPSQKIDSKALIQKLIYCELSFFPSSHIMMIIYDNIHKMIHKKGYNIRVKNLHFASYFLSKIKYEEIALKLQFVYGKKLSFFILFIEKIIIEKWFQLGKIFYTWSYELWSYFIFLHLRFRQIRILTLYIMNFVSFH